MKKSGAELLMLDSLLNLT